MLDSLTTTNTVTTLTLFLLTREWFSALVLCAVQMSLPCCFVKRCATSTLVTNMGVWLYGNRADME